MSQIPLLIVNVLKSSEKSGQILFSWTFTSLGVKNLKS